MGDYLRNTAAAEPMDGGCLLGPCTDGLDMQKGMSPGAQHLTTHACPGSDVKRYLY